MPRCSYSTVLIKKKHLTAWTTVLLAYSECFNHSAHMMCNFLMISSWCYDHNILLLCMVLATSLRNYRLWCFGAAFMWHMKPFFSSSLPVVCASRVSEIIRCWKPKRRPWKKAWTRESFTLVSPSLVPRPLPDFILQNQFFSIAARQNLGVAWGQG